MSEQNVVTFRLPEELTQQVCDIAAREFETRSTILRRLLRLGLTDYQVYAAPTPPLRSPGRGEVA